MDVTRAYATLGVTRATSDHDLRLAYRAALRRDHPDTGTGDLPALRSDIAAYREIATLRHRPGPSPTPAAAARHIDVYA